MDDDVVPLEYRLPTTYVLPVESVVIAEILYGYASPSEIAKSPEIASVEVIKNKTQRMCS